MRPVDIVSSKEDAPALAFFKERSTVERLADEDIRDRQADRDLREKYAKKAFILACAILIFWGVIIITVGLWFGCSGEKVQPLSDKVLMAITAGATANVFAAFLGVIRGLFPGREKSHRKSEL
jgi:hypothetical protein